MKGDREKMKQVMLAKYVRGIYTWFQKGTRYLLNHQVYNFNPALISQYTCNLIEL